MLSQNPKSMVSHTFLLFTLSVAFISGFELAIAASLSPSSPSSTGNLTLSALLALKASISSDPTGLFASWNTSSHFCTWQGILCSNDSQQVKALLLNSKRLNGTLPPQIADLQGLSYLNVSNNSFHGSVPVRIGDLASTFTHFDLSANNFTGSIPASLARCTLLQYIDLNSNDLSGEFPSYITNFTMLGYLDLSLNSITGELPHDIGLLSKLGFLQVHDTRVTGAIPPSLMNCSSLVWLDLADTSLSGPLPSDWTKLASTLQQLKLMDISLSSRIPPSLMNCTMLIDLDVQNSSLIGEIPQSIGQLSLLQDLRLYMNNLSGPVPPSIANCTRLVSLQLSYNNFSGVIPEDIGRLTRAEWIGFSGNPLIKGTIPSSIGGCEQLQVLSLFGTAIGGSLPNSLFNLSNLQTLKLQDCAFSGILSPGVRQLTSLQDLILSNNAFEGSIPAQLGELKSLQGLYMQDNKFSGSIPDELSGCISMAEMNLSSNPISGSIPSSFAQLQALSALSIRHTRISGPIPDIFASLARLQSLDLAYNMLTGSIPASLVGLDTINILLDLSFNNLTGTIPATVGGMQKLQTMNLCSNKLTGKIPVAFGNCQGMQMLDLSMNRLEGGIPASLGQMQSLQYLDVSENFLSGALPSSLGLLDYLVYLNVSYNALDGQIPTLGVYKNSSAFFFLGNPSLCGYPSSTSCGSNSTHNNHSRRVAIIVSACVAGAAVLGAVLCACLWWCCGKNKDASHSEDTEAEDSEPDDFSDMETPGIKAWTAKEMIAATNDFNVANMLGSGGVSVCYKAVIEESSKRSKKHCVVAIKRLNVGDYREAEARRSFVNELKTICKVRHRNLVKVLGYCVDGGEVALVMEHMEEGDLDRQLHGKEGGMNWDKRLNVAIDVAEGLVYLHHEYVQPIVHCDLKPKNILLGSDMVAKISDFGIAKLLDMSHAGDMSTSKFRGTFGYAAPEYAAGLRISTKADVYSYGVLLLELVTGVRPISPRLQEEGISIHTWARKLQETGQVREALDAKLEPEMVQEAEELFGLGVKCTVDAVKERPGMQAVRDIVKGVRARRIVMWKGGKKSFPDMEELIQDSGHTLSLPEASKWLLNPGIQVDCSALNTSSSHTSTSS